MTEPLDPKEAKSRQFSFRPSARSPRIRPDQAKRQGEVANLAFLHLGGRERAMAFLNNHDSDLEGRPLDIAVSSEEGCARVCRAIRRIATSRSVD